MKIGNGHSYKGDTLTVMDDLIAEGVQVDFVLTSPPYNMHGHQHEFYIAAHESKTFKDAKTEEEYRNWIVNIFLRYDQLLRKTGIVIFNMNYMSSKKSPAINMLRTITEIEDKTPFTLIDQICWKKPNSVMLTNGTRLSRAFENVWVFIRKDDWDAFNDRFLKKLLGVTNYIEAPNNDGTNEINKACFSSSFVQQALEKYLIKKQHVVLDNFMGTHTTAIACEKIGCKWIGIEMDEETITYGRDRVKDFIGEFNTLEKYKEIDLFSQEDM